MSTARLPKNEFTELVKAIRQNLPDRVQLTGYPEYVSIKVEGWDPSPGQEYWVTLHIEPESPVEEETE